MITDPVTGRMIGETITTATTAVRPVVHMETGIQLVAHMSTHMVAQVIINHKLIADTTRMAVVQVTVSSSRRTAG
jgi:coproporphyrinogen III oxidase